jgi:hypothetical protein
MGIVGLLRAKSFSVILRLGLPLILLAATSFNPAIAAQKSAKTFTATVTPTITPTATDSLAVFETPLTATPDTTRIFITSPVPGERVQGKVSIVGKTAVDNFSFSEISFSYSNNPTNTWFVISKSQQSYSDEELAVWDTTTITDGSYDIRLRVYTGGDEFKEIIVKGVKVSNYTATETPRPTSTSLSQPTDEHTSTPTATQTPFPTPTLLPLNPAELAQNAILANIGRGALVIMAFFAVFGLFLRVRNRK